MEIDLSTADISWSLLGLLKGKRVTARYHLYAEIYVFINYLYTCVDVHKFYISKDDNIAKYEYCSQFSPKLM